MPIIYSSTVLPCSTHLKMFHPPFCFQLNRSPELPGRRVGALWPWKFWPRPPTWAARSGLGVSGAARRPKWTSQAPRPGCQGNRGRESLKFYSNEIACLKHTHTYHISIYLLPTCRCVYIYIYTIYYFLYTLCINHWSQLVVLFFFHWTHVII